MTDLPPIDYTLSPALRTAAALVRIHIERQRNEANERERDELTRALERALEAV